MPEEQVARRAQRDKKEGKSPSTQAGEFVREEIHHIREGKHGAKSPQQAIAIGLSKARRAGVKLPAPEKGRVSAKTQTQAMRDSRKGKSRGRRTSRVRSRATAHALKREGRSATSRRNLSRHARSVARRRGTRSRRQSARKAARTRVTTR
jgi:predicted SPOUT superfamily RNA methylase MTH1